MVLHTPFFFSYNPADYMISSFALSSSPPFFWSIQVLVSSHFSSFFCFVLFLAVCVCTRWDRCWFLNLLGSKLEVANWGKTHFENFVISYLVKFRILPCPFFVLYSSCDELSCNVNRLRETFVALLWIFVALELDIFLAKSIKNPPAKFQFRLSEPPIGRGDEMNYRVSSDRHLLTCEEA